MTSDIVHTVSSAQQRALDLVKAHGWLARWPNDIWAPKRPAPGWSAFAKPENTDTVRGSTVRALIKAGQLVFRGGAARLPRDAEIERLRSLIKAQGQHPGCTFHACPACVALETEALTDDRESTGKQA